VLAPSPAPASTPIAPVPAPSAAAPEPGAAASAALEAAGSAAAPAGAPPEAHDAAALRQALVDAAKDRHYVEAVDALLVLAERDPTALRDRKVAVATRNVAIAIAKTGEEHADKVFDALANRLGSPGIDVLYEIVESRGRSTPARRAASLLRKPEVAARGTPAARISFELRDASCGEKLRFLDRAVEDGDDRTLVVLETVVKPCFDKSRAIDDAIKKLRARLPGK
jgi:hypothetical protein